MLRDIDKVAVVDALTLLEPLSERVTDKVTEVLRVPEGTETLAVAESVGERENDSDLDGEQLVDLLWLGARLGLRLTLAI